MNYKPRPGIVQTKICGVHVLIPTREAYEYCKAILRLPMLWAMTFELLEKGEADENIIRLHKILTKKPEEEICSRIERFCEELSDKGFLIKENVEEKQ